MYTYTNMLQWIRINHLWYSTTFLIGVVILRGRTAALFYLRMPCTDMNGGSPPFFGKNPR